MDEDTCASWRPAPERGSRPASSARARPGRRLHRHPPGVDLAGYLERFDRAPERLLETGKPPDYPAPVARTWQLNVEELTTSCPAAVDLLRLCAFLAPETPIPTDLITAKVEVLPEALRAAAGSNLGLDEPVAALYRSSLVSSDRDGVRVHRLVQAVTRHALGGAAASWHARAVYVVLAAFPGRPWDLDQWPQAAVALPHAQQVTQVANEDASVGVATLLDAIGWYLHGRGELRAAGAEYERLLEIKERVYGADHLEVAQTRSEVGLWLSLLGEPDQGRAMLERALTIFDAKLGKDHPDTQTVRQLLDLLQGD